MLHKESNKPSPSIASLRSGMLAVGILWILVLWNLGISVEVNDREHNGVPAVQDHQLLASGDYSFSIKRFSPRYHDYPSSLKLSDPFWILHSAEIAYWLPIFFRAQQHALGYLSVDYQYHLLSLNSPRAPPLV